MRCFHRLLRAFKRLVFPQKTHYWEYYGRMKLVSDFLKIEGAAESTVLDVGGAPGDNLLRQFGISTVTILDVNRKADIVASADQIPLPDQSFDYVTCIDTMEHIRQELRPQVIEELVRVARLGIIIVAPQDTEHNRRAEDLVLQYVDDCFLREHRAFGLWNARATEEQLQKLKTGNKIARYERREIDDLLTWTVLMTMDHANSSEIYAKASFLENQFFGRRVAFLIWKRGA